MNRTVFEIVLSFTKQLNNALLFVKIIKPPTQIARMLMGNTLTKYAEIGAATIPPRLKAITANQLI